MQTTGQVALVEDAHTSDAEFVMRTHQIQRATGWRVQADMADGWTEAAFRKSEILECAAHEDAGGVNGLIELRLAINQQDTPTLLTQQTRAA
jgi:hypothetical protein